jgi:hypothetical protein
MSLPHQQSETSGVTPFKQAGYQDGATSPRSNAMAYRSNQTSQQQSINKTGGSKKRRRKHKGGSGQVVVPSFSSSGPPVSAGGQDVNSNSQGTNSTHLQTKANGSCDSCIGNASNTEHCQSAACNPQAGGGSCNGSGLVGPNQTWACMSGGKKRISRKNKKGGGTFDGLLAFGRIRGQKYEKWLEQRLVLVFDDLEYVNKVREIFGYDKTNIRGRGKLTKEQVEKEVCDRSTTDQEIIDPRLNCKKGGYKKTKRKQTKRTNKKSKRTKNKKTKK